MFDKTSSFYVFEYLEECPPVEELARLFRERPFVNIAETDNDSDYCYVGPDQINSEKNFIIHPARGLIGLSILYQSRKINNELVNATLEAVLADEYFGQKLSKDDLRLVKDNVINSLMSKFPVVYRYSDFVIDQKNSRIYIRSSGDGLLFSTLRQINHLLDLPSLKMRSWFSGDFIEKAGGWENTQTLFLHWLNGVCQGENKYNIFAGTKLDLSDRYSRIKITGNNERFKGIWDLFVAGRKIDSVHVLLKEKVPKEGDREEYFREVLQYKLSVKKLGFYELRLADFYYRKIRASGGLAEKIQSVETFLEHFDSLCVAFQSAMKNYDMKDLYAKIMKLDTDENK